MKVQPENIDIPPQSAELLGVISEHPFLRGMSHDHLQVLSASAMLKEFEQGELIFGEGDVANRFYLIQKGRVALESSDENRTLNLVQHIGGGDVLGWSWLFPPYYWHFDARAAEPTSAIFFYGTRLREQCEADPALGYDLMNRMANVIIDRLQSTRKQLLECERRERLRI